jgi:hypothetical protein
MEALQSSCDLDKPPEGNDVACGFGDVGVTRVETVNGRLIGWSFLLPLENYEAKVKYIVKLNERSPGRGGREPPKGFLIGRFAKSSAAMFIDKIFSVASYEERQRLSFILKNSSN